MSMYVRVLHTVSSFHAYANSGNSYCQFGVYVRNDYLNLKKKNFFSDIQFCGERPAFSQSELSHMHSTGGENVLNSV